MPAGNSEIFEDSQNENEDDPCHPQGPNAMRRSMELLNKSRDNEDSAKVSVQNADRKSNEARINYKGNSFNKSQNKFGVICFNTPQSRFEKWCSEKTGLSRFGLIVQGLILLLLIILIIVVTLMTCLWPTLPHSLVFPICRTSACLLASSEMVSKMNQSEHPCNDIRSYACGYWFSTQSIPSHKSSWGVKQHMKSKYKEKIRNMIVTMPDLELDQLQIKIKNIYDSCMSKTVETEDKRPLKKIITKLGGWRVLRDFDLQNWDFKMTLKYLHSEYNVEPFFKIEVVPDGELHGGSIIQISPGSLGLPDKSYYYRPANDKVVLAYKRFLVDVAVTMGATSDEASIFSEDMFGFEKRLAERFPSRVSEHSDQYREKITKLENIATSVPFMEILSFLFPKANLNKDSSTVLVIASDYLVNVSRIISTTDRSVLNDYLMLKLAIGYLPHLSQKHRSTIVAFHKQLYGFSEPVPRWEFCITTLQQFMGFGLEALMENAHPEHGRKRKVVNEMFQQITTTLENAVETSSNLPSHMKDHFLDKIKNIGLQVGLPTPMKHSDYYSSYYRQLVTIKDDYFNNILNGVNFLVEEKQKRLKGPVEEHWWMDIVSDGNLKVAYIPELNKVVVPYALLEMPYFNSHFPWSVLYGGIGAELGMAVLASITGKGLHHSGGGTLLTSDHPVCNITHECFSHHPESTLYLESLKYTFKALENVLAALPHTHQPALEYLEDHTIFFVAYAQSVCSLKTAEQQDIDLTLKSHLSDTDILEIIMSKSQQFSSVFQCGNTLQKDVCDSLI